MAECRDYRIALAVVVTRRALSEFLVLKYSFELFHGPHQWFVRCDDAVRAELAGDPNVHAVVSADERVRPGDMHSKQRWRELMAEKMNAIEDAWTGGECDAVLYLDTDIVVFSPFLDAALALGGQVVLSPHHYSRLSGGEDHYNGGFVLMRDRTFHHWWRRAAAAERDHAADQISLRRAQEAYNVKEMTAAANVGWWRGSIREALEVPTDCQFCHVHLLQDGDQLHELSQKTFALNCVEYLLASPVREHRLIADTILALDASGYYETLLRRRVSLITACEPRRAIRLLLMAKTVPRQVPVHCLCHGSPEDLTRRLRGESLPPHVTVSRADLSNDRYASLGADERRAELAFLVDIDFVFPLGFWRKVCLAHRSWHTGEGATSPVPLRDPDGRFLSHQFWLSFYDAVAAGVAFGEGDRAYKESVICPDILERETTRTHYLPETPLLMECAEPVLADVPWIREAASANRPACIEAETRNGADTPWPGLLVSMNDVLERRRVEKIRVATNCYIFHLWHPANAESPVSGSVPSFLTGAGRA